MAGIREIAREYRNEIMDGIAWVAIWKTGKSWNAKAFWLNTESDMIEDEDMQEARDIVTADANAIFINEYYCAHMEDGTVEDIVAGIKFFYEEGWHKLADSTAYRAEEENQSMSKLTVERDREDLRVAVAVESQKQWDKEEKTVTMTQEQWNKLTCYLIMSTNHREGEAKAWEKLAEEKTEDGSPKFKNAAENAEYWREMVTDIEEIRKKIDEA